MPMLCVELLLRAKDLIDEAMWTHIYNADDGEEPGEECAYQQWVNDCDLYLLEK